MISHSQTALSAFFQETNIPYGHHHQMVSIKAAIYVLSVYFIKLFFFSVTCVCYATMRAQFISWL